VTYQQYLQSDHWIGLRTARIAAAKGRCELCKKPARFVEAHHLIYRESWFDTVASDLRCLHSDCHRWIHKNFRCLKNERLDKVWSVILNTFKYGRAKPCKKRKASRRFFKDYIPRRVVRGNTKQRRPQPA
jgi:hypothetical protein